MQGLALQLLVSYVVFPSSFWLNDIQQCYIRLLACLVLAGSCSDLAGNTVALSRDPCALTGFGRIGRLVARSVLERDDVELVGESQSIFMQRHLPLQQLSD